MLTQRLYRPIPAKEWLRQCQHGITCIYRAEKWCNPHFHMWSGYWTMKRWVIILIAKHICNFYSYILHDEPVSYTSPLTQITNTLCRVLRAVVSIKLGGAGGAASGGGLTRVHRFALSCNVEVVQWSGDVIVIIIIIYTWDRLQRIGTKQNTNWRYIYTNLYIIILPGTSATNFKIAAKQSLTWTTTSPAC